ncbi:MAG: hypothetical protein KF791_08390 [Verrucomicrobiae bacterium]|nr:hypothetical protein [Verrucomicrobiae bacterium]
MSPEQKAEQIRSKILAGLTRQQAEDVVAAQEDWDADPANPVNGGAKAPPTKPDGDKDKGKK